MKAKARVTNGEIYDDIYVTILVKSTTPIPPSLASNGCVYAKLDGNPYDLTTNKWSNPRKDFIYIDDQSPYVLEYYVGKIIDGDNFQTVDNLEVEVEIEVSTSEEEIEQN